MATQYEQRVSIRQRYPHSRIREAQNQSVSNYFDQFRKIVPPELVDVEVKSIDAAEGVMIFTCTIPVFTGYAETRVQDVQLRSVKSILTQLIGDAESAGDPNTAAIFDHARSSLAIFEQHDAETGD